MLCVVAKTGRSASPKSVPTQSIGTRYVQYVIDQYKIWEKDMKEAHIGSTVARRLSLTQPATYQIKVQGYLGSDWADWFDGLRILPEMVQDGLPVTTLTGKVVDQAALHGLLGKLYGLGLPLLEVKYLDLHSAS
jgi:hypothetical protein